MSVRDDTFARYAEETKLSPSAPLYHDWLYDRLFSGDNVSEGLKKRIKRAIHESLISGFAIGEFAELRYFKNLYSHVVVPYGEFKGQKIMGLPNSKEVWLMLNELVKSTKSDLVRKACGIKLRETKESLELDRSYINKRLKKYNVYRKKW